MFPIDTPTAVAVQPARRPAGAPGFWTNGNPLALPPLPCTIGDQDWFNIVQQEISNAITLRGIALNKADETQLFQAMKKGELIAVQPFFTAGTFHPTFNSATGLLDIWLGGAAGGSGGAALGATSGGGGSGAYLWHRIAPAGFVGAALVIGAAGLAGLATPTNGGNGGTSTYGGLTAPGGGGSPAANSGSTPATFGGGGGAAIATGGNQLNRPGRLGGYGFVMGSFFADGLGAPGPYGVDGGQGVPSPQGGNPGTDGFCIIYEYG